MKALPYKVLTLQLLYRGSEQNFSASVFHILCDKQGPTITIMKSKSGRIFGGFTRQHWDSPQQAKLKEDYQAFLFSIDLQKKYKVISPGNAIYCNSEWGPSFGGMALALISDPLNKEKGGKAQSNGFNDGIRYGIRTDNRGNNELTGEGTEQETDSKLFTCEEIEVYAVSFNE